MRLIGSFVYLFLQDAEGLESSKVPQKILSTARLFLRNLTFTVTYEELEELFTPFGPIEQVSICYLIFFSWEELQRRHKPIGTSYLFANALRVDDYWDQNR
jgi:hypothetical protein